jgi:hypothetical protein
MVTPRVGCRGSYLHLLDNFPGWLCAQSDGFRASKHALHHGQAGCKTRVRQCVLHAAATFTCRQKLEFLQSHTTFPFGSNAVQRSLSATPERNLQPPGLLPLTGHRIPSNNNRNHRSPSDLCEAQPQHMAPLMQHQTRLCRNQRVDSSPHRARQEPPSRHRGCPACCAGAALALARSADTVHNSTGEGTQVAARTPPAWLPQHHQLLPKTAGKPTANHRKSAVIGAPPALARNPKQQPRTTCSKNSAVCLC